MASEKHVPVDAFVTVVKSHLHMINDLSAALMALRIVLQRAGALPISEQQMRDAEAAWKAGEMYQRTRQSIDDIGVRQSIEDFLKGFDGPVQ